MMECKEATSLESYFLFLANFSHDRAREVVATETGLPAATLGHLALAEKQYLGLTFLQPRTSVFQVRKEPALRAVYQGIATELKAVGGGAAWLLEAAALANLRSRAIEVYERLASCSASQAPPYHEVTGTLGALAEAVVKVGEEVAVEPWRAAVRCEIQALLDFLSAAVDMQHWHFFPALMNFARGAELLGQWEDVVGARETRKLSFASSLLRGVTGWVEPHLYLWLGKLKAALLSKFSLYFYQTLAKQAPQQEVQRLCSKLATDQAARLAAFQRRVDALAVSVVFSAGLEQGDSGRPGYTSTSGESSHPTGLDCFPTVFSCPQNIPDHLFPGLVMILTDRSSELATDRTSYFFDIGLGATYFIHNLEPRFHMVTICEGRRSEKDSAINSFIQETVGQIRCSKLCNSLKPGYK